MLAWLLKKIYDHKTYVKYVISGGTAFLTDLVILWFLTDIVGWWYLASAIAAFAFAYFVSFYLQKFWTFRDETTEELARQMGKYLIVGLSNLGVNTVGMYFLVDIVGIMYLIAQMFMSMGIAIGSFLIYKFLIFRKVRKNEEATIKKQDEDARKFKVLIATPIYPPDIGGPATYSKILADELPKRGYAVQIVTYSDEKLGVKDRFSGKSYMDNETDKNIIVHKVPRRMFIVLRYAKYFWNVCKLIPWADAIYVQHQVSAGLPSCIACWLHKRKFILKIVGDYAWEQGQARFGVKEMLDDFEPKKYGWRVRAMHYVQVSVTKHASSVITPSEYLKKVVQRWAIEEDKIKVIYNAVPVHDVKISKDEARQELGLSGNVILSVGRLVPWKGMDTLISVIPELLKVNSDIKLVIAGDGPEFGDLESGIRDLGLGDKVKLLGKVEYGRLLKYIKAADMFVLNTGYEGLPHLVIEAMQVGTPVITSRVGGNTEVVENGRNGTLIAYNNKEELVSAILDLYKNPEKGVRMAEEAMRGLDKFEKEKMIEAVIDNLRAVGL